MPKKNYWTRAEHELIAEFFALGRTYAQIGMIIGRTERSVANKCHELGLRHYRRDTRRSESVKRRQIDIAVECLDLVRTLGEAEGWQDVIDEIDLALEKIARVGRRSISSRSPSPSVSPV